MLIFRYEGCVKGVSVEKKNIKNMQSTPAVIKLNWTNPSCLQISVELLPLKCRVWEKQQGFSWWGPWTVHTQIKSVIKIQSLGPHIRLSEPRCLRRWHRARIKIATSTQVRGSYNSVPWKTTVIQDWEGFPETLNFIAFYCQAGVSCLTTFQSPCFNVSMF